MHSDIETLQDFVAYDKSHLDDLYPDIPFTFDMINRALYEKAESFFLVYGHKPGNDPILELIELLDGNNFTVIDNSIYQVAKIIPLYPEGSE